jgi:hypothetical protein
LNTEDIIEIYQLESRAHHVIDHVDFETLLPTVFTQDARFDGRQTGGPLHVGIDAIIHFFALGKPPHPPAHQASSNWVYEEDGKVYCKSKWFILDPEGSGIFIGDNTDEVVKTDEGWRIKERVAMLRGGSINPEAAAASMK